jgi:hypothetical protein
MLAIKMKKHTDDKSKGIVSWPQNERPREMLLSKGPEALSDAALLAILLRTGRKGQNAIELARELIERFGGPCPLHPFLCPHTIPVGDTPARPSEYRRRLEQGAHGA